ncbi:hypothetical protein PRIPAC_89272 [Pristionchus pacificus]|uniref:Uncharacterized protein n=1 Tax=Pristionchus pacificus TaxID=54126 RepID=A0A2A6CVB6_PRIPA|nr:hypothetical protein PRIPAC_89272 [Pristionchus pacificus]|eukprot:PDM82026.1 hypothetical protein PRIPAC_36419 [Pristionchus pacificus]
MVFGEYHPLIERRDAQLDVSRSLSWAIHDGEKEGLSLSRSRHLLDFDNVLRELCADRQLDFLVEELVLHASLLIVSSKDGVDDAVGFKLAWMGVGNAIGCPVTAEPQFLQLLHTLSASRWCEVASLTGKKASHEYLAN